jgi:hypothetical protein
VKSGSIEDTSGREKAVAVEARRSREEVCIVVVQVV